MIKKQIRVIGVFFICLMVMIAFITTTGSYPLPQAYYYTPTPQADGRILYTVKANDTCISIALLNGITEDDLRNLNNLQGDDCLYLQEGQQLTDRCARRTDRYHRIIADHSGTHPHTPQRQRHDLYLPLQ